VNPLLAILATPTIGTAVELADGAVAATQDSFASMLKAASERLDACSSPDIDLAADDEAADDADSLVESILNGLEGMFAGAEG
jgi:hypothetical protein